VAAYQKYGPASPEAMRVRTVSIDALLEAPNPAIAGTEDYTPLKPHTPVMDNINIKPTADRHLSNFFATVHTLLPVLHEASFRALYENFWSRMTCQGGSPRSEGNLRRATSPLVYAVLALGALYEDGYDDHVLWAKEWFAKAREGIDHAAEECCFEICLAIFFLVSFIPFCAYWNRLHTLNMLSSRTLRIIILEWGFGLPILLASIDPYRRLRILKRRGLVWEK
jgi:Fungal specific transcription factor domain